MKRIREKDPQTFKMLMRTGPVVQVLFAALEYGVPAMAFRSYQMTTREDQSNANTSDGKICAKECEGNRLGLSFASLGANREITKYFAKGGKLINAFSPAPFLLGLMGLEIKADPAEVVEPVSVLVLDRLGFRWYQNQAGACPDLLK